LILAMGLPVVLGIGALAVAVRASSGPGRTVQVAAVPLPSSATAPALERPAVALQQGETPPARTATVASPMARPTLDLQVPDVSAHAEGDEMVVTFDHGLFNTGQTDVRSDELGAVQSVGRALGLLGNRISIVVEGRTDEQPVKHGRYRDNAGLAMSRALTVAEELRSVSGLDPRAFSVRGAGTPNDVLDEETRARARSAVVRVRNAR
jgi:flagellar motor protein MotB